jgi:hypothetical protein
MVMYEQLAKRHEPGSISHGTLLPEDLGSAMVNVAAECAPEWLKALSADYEIDLECAPAEFWRSDNGVWALDDLYDMMQSFAPPGHAFGCHPGDGSDCGFWPIDLFDDL